MEENSCAEKAGIQAGDIIIAFNGATVERNADLTSQLKKVKAGDTVELTVYRAGEEITLSVTLDEKPQTDETEAQETYGDSEQNDESTVPTLPDGFEDFWPGFGN